MKKVALLKVEDIIVSLKCPHCKAKLPPPNWPDSAGWDKKDVKVYGKKGQVKCEKCGKEVPLPAQLFEIAG